MAKVVAEVPSLGVVINDGQPPESLVTKIISSREGVTVLSLDFFWLMRTRPSVPVDTLFGSHLTPEDTFLAFLPLAHILEYVVEA